MSAKHRKCFATARTVVSPESRHAFGFLSSIISGIVAHAVLSWPFREKVSSKNTQLKSTADFRWVHFTATFDSQLDSFIITRQPGN